MDSTLQYGHVGTATYAQEFQSWEFSRKLNNDTPLALVDEVNIATPGFHDCCFWRISKKDISFDKRKKGVLSSRHPELASSSGVIGSYETSSKTITSAVDDFEPAFFERLAFGNAESVENGRLTNQMLPIMVSVCNDSSVTLTPLEFESRSAENPPGVESTHHQQSFTWVADGLVEQICVAEAVDERDIYFAARLSLSTTIFRPLYYQTSVPGRYESGSFLPGWYSAPRLDPNPLVRIPSALTGGHPHVAVAINPWYQGQIAIIDRIGNWTIWNIERKQRKDGWFSECGPSGLLPFFTLGNTKHPRIDRYDGWAAVSWVADVHQILVCSRRDVALCRINASPPEQYKVDLGLGRPSEWILGITRSKKNLSHVFVLTTMRVFWLHVASNGDNFSSQAHDHGRVSILLSWQHFRDFEDTSLQLTSVLIDDECFIVLFSRLNFLGQVFQTRFSSEEPPVPVSVSDPLLIPPCLGTNGGHQCETRNGGEMCFSSLLIKGLGYSVKLEKDNANLKPKFAQSICKRTDSGARGSTFSAIRAPISNAWPHAQSYDIEEMVRWPVSNKPKRINHLNFLVDDDDRSFQLLDDRPLQDHLVSPSLSRHSRSSCLEHWKSQHALLSSTASNLIVGKDTNLVQTMSFGTWLGLLPDSIRALMLTYSASSMPQTIFHTVGISCFVDEIEHDSLEFHNTFQFLKDHDKDLLPNHQLSYLPLSYSATSRFSPVSHDALTEFRLLGVYDSLLYNWLSILSDKIPNKIRASKEEITRAITAELMLSRVTLFRNEASKPETNELHWSRSSQNISTPTPNDTITDEPLYNSLRRYTSINGYQSISKRSAVTISHWNIATDPSTYNWYSTTVSREEEQSQSEIEKNTRRKRRARRTQKSFMSPGIGARRTGLSSNSDIDRLWGSQPERSNSQYSQRSEDGVPMSQIERGLFGGRETRKRPVLRKGKKRAAGF